MGVCIVLAIAVAFGLLLLWPKIQEQTLGSSQSAPPKTSQHDSEKLGDTTRQACHFGPYDVTSGMPTKIKLDVVTGDKIQGHVQEVDGDFFDWYIVDEDNMLRFLNSKTFDYIDGDENAQASKVRCRVTHSGPWYLMLDIGNRRNDRRVEVDLRVTHD